MEEIKMQLEGVSSLLDAVYEAMTYGAKSLESYCEAVRCVRVLLDGISEKIETR